MITDSEVVRVNLCQKRVSQKEESQMTWNFLVGN